MASPAEIGLGLPDTLPEDFSEWDGGDSPASLPADPSNREEPADSSAAFRSPVQRAEPQATVASTGEELPEQLPSPPATHNDHGSVSAALLNTELLSKALGIHSEARKTEPLAIAPVQPARTVEKAASLLPDGIGIGADGPQDFAPLLPPAPGADEEAFFNQLRAIGSVLNTRQIGVSHRSLLAREPEEISFKPALPSTPAVRSVPVPMQAPPASSAAVAPSASKERRWPADPIHVTATIAPEAAVCTPSFHSGLAEDGDENFIWKKWMKVAAFGAVSVLLLVFLGYRLLSPGKPTLAKQSVLVQTAADVDPATPVHKPSPSMQMAGARSSSGGSASSGFTTVQMGADGAGASEPHVDSQLMSDQLAAAPQIPRDVKTKVTEDAPPPDSINVASNGEAAVASAIGSVFSAQAQPKVAYVPLPAVTIPSSTADSLVIERTKPVYPSEAWYDHVTGKVALEVTVSRTGTVENVRFMSGAHIFKQAALDAVQSWRYKPYVIDNLPREFTTTVEVTFDQSSVSNPLSLLHVGSHAKKDATAPKDADQQAQ
jgi:TonB family protein